MENVESRVELQIRERAFNRRIHTFAIVNKNHVDIEDFLSDAYHQYQSEVLRILNEFNIVKSMTIFAAEFEKKNVNLNNDDGDADGNSSSEQTIKQTLYLTTSNKVIDLETNLNEHYQKNVIDEVVKSVDQSAFRGSGFSLSRIIELGVQICAYQPLAGSTYITTPKKIKSKRAIINVQNDDEMCFKWAILAALHPPKNKKNAQKLFNYYAYCNELNFDGINFPVRLNQIDRFTQQNSTISINVYYFDEDDARVYPLRVSSVLKEHHIHLLLIFDTENECVAGGNTTANKIKLMMDNWPIRTHYCWIKDLGRLVGSQLSKHGHKTFICDRCLNYFTTNEKLKKHTANCASECQIVMPTDEKKWIQFKNYEKQLKAPFVVYADTEAFQRRLSADEKKRLFSANCNTTADKQHHVYSVGYFFKCEFDSTKSFYASSGIHTNCIEWFVQELEKIAMFVASMILNIKPINPLTLDEQRLAQDPNAKCHICGDNFVLNEKRNLDHCHFTGEYRGVAHSGCNLNYQDSRFVPVIMHNLTGYDAHMFIRELATKIKGDIAIIPLNAEEYISFTKVVLDSAPWYNDIREKIRLKFLDSFRFMPESLSKLASWLPVNEKRILYSECEKDYSPEQIAMLERKGVFPYDYIDSIDRLSETSLPPKDKFKNELNDEDISDEDYAFACSVWDKFQLKTLGEYSEIYMKADVLLLADIFENFRDSCHKIYKLDPAHYFTSPGLSFDAMLKYTQVEIELLTDIEMLLFVERGIRGGISQCSIRHLKANNKYMRDENDRYDPNKESIYLMYLDGEIFFSQIFIL